MAAGYRLWLGEGRVSRFESGLSLWGWINGGYHAHEDFGNAFPLPVILLRFSAGYKALDVQNNNFPGTYKNGDVLLAWFRYGF